MNQVEIDPFVLRRRDFMRLAAAGFLTGFLVEPQKAAAAPTRQLYDIDPSRAAESVFGLSVASGDPSTSGVILWTRINPEAIVPGLDAGVEVATDATFTALVLRARLAASELSAARDYTIKLDLDGYLLPGQRYFYRFVYNRTVSRTGRCRTLPAPDATPGSLRLAFVTCQDFLPGYYNAFAHIAADDSVDFVLHSGDYIYETFGDPRFQSQSVRKQSISLPSYEPPNKPPAEGEEIVALSLADYRRIYQIYKSDHWLQQAHERHTWIVGWDDHEMADDNYHDYTGDANGQSQTPPGHPFQDQPDASRQLKFDSQQAWGEYIPARVTYHPTAPDIFARLSIYRSFTFGQLAQIFVTDERTYRTAPPGGNKDFPDPTLLFTNPPAALSSRYFSLPSAAQTAPGGTMLGNGSNGAPNQRDWLLDGLRNSTARWKIWSNEVYHGRLVVGVPQASFPAGTPAELVAALQPSLNAFNAFFAANPLLTTDNDAWDGYQAERSLLAQALAAAQVQNLVALTGDLHSTLASIIKVDYSGPETAANVIGVEYMTPAISSASFSDIIAGFLTSNAPSPSPDPVTQVFGQILGTLFTQIAGQVLVENGPVSLNPHLKYFDSRRHGYALVDFTTADCVFSAYSVDLAKDTGTAATRSLYAQFRTPSGASSIEQIVPAPAAPSSLSVKALSEPKAAAVRHHRRKKKPHHPRGPRHPKRPRHSA